MLGPSFLYCVKVLNPETGKIEQRDIFASSTLELERKKSELVHVGFVTMSHKQITEVLEK